MVNNRLETTYCYLCLVLITLGRRPSCQVLWLSIATVFMKEANFPNCNGAIDGKHIKINYPTPSGSLYYNYKKYYSIVLLAVVDAYYRLTTQHSQAPFTIITQSITP